MLRGKARFKQKIASLVSIDLSTLPWRTQFIDGLRQQRAQGRTLVLATGSDMQLARHVADRLDLFDTVFASDGKVNLHGNAKRDRLIREFGANRFDYAADGGGMGK